MLRDETGRWDANLRAGQWIAGCCAVCSLLSGDTKAITAAWALGGFAFTWFTLGRRSRGVTRRFVVAATPSFALLIGPVATVILARVNPSMAYTQWFTPLLSIIVIALSVQRLEPWRPLIYGVVAAALYILAYDAATWDMNPAARVGWALRPATQLVRASFFVGTGAAFAMVTRSLKAALVDKTRYRFGTVIATGSSATVVHAAVCGDAGFEKIVAVKKLHARDPVAVEAFRAEAEVGARLVHPNIVAVVDFGRCADGWFIAMEHVAGRDLRAMLGSLQQRGLTVPPPLAGFIACEILQGLACAHAARVVHRDVSPANVLVSKNGEVKVADFGAVAGGRGTLAYSAPELARGEIADARADVFSVGVILWEMLTCERLFKRPTTQLTMKAVLETAVPTARVSSSWDALLARALAHDPRRRFSSARAMIDAVEEVLRAGEGLARSQDLAKFIASPGVPLEPTEMQTVAPHKRRLHVVKPPQTPAVAPAPLRGPARAEQGFAEDDWGDIGDASTAIDPHSKRLRGLRSAG